MDLQQNYMNQEKIVTAHIPLQSEPYLKLDEQTHLNNDSLQWELNYQEGAYNFAL